MPKIIVNPLVIMHKPIANWSSRDILVYYSNKLKELTGQHLDIPPVAWQGFMARIKGFKDKMKISNEDYKAFIDRVFQELFVSKRYIPAFGSIVSERVYSILKSHSLKQYNNDDFIALRNKLFQDSFLFSTHE